jgi:4-amino-4-deoxychorismate lyase
MTPIAMLDGRLVSALPWDDRGLAYGDGLFETMAVEAGRALFLDLHLERLQRDCGRLRIGIDLQTLRGEIAACLPADGRGVLKIIVTRFPGGRGYRPQADRSGRRLLLFHPQADAPLTGTALRMRLCRQRLSLQPALAGMKHLNRLEQVLARGEWSDPAIGEGLMLDTQGRLIEATAANLFLISGSDLLTPRLTRCGVAGVMRRIVIERLAPALGLPVREIDLPLPELYAADELFLTSSLLGIAPVQSVDCLQVPQGGVTIALQSQLERLRIHEIS